MLINADVLWQRDDSKLYNHDIVHVLTVFHEMTELLVPHSAVRCAIKVHHSLNLIPSKVSHTATANHQTTDELGGTNKNDRL